MPPKVELSIAVPYSLTPLVSEESVLLSMGVPPGKEVKPRLLRYVNEAVSIAREHARPQFIYRELSLEDVSNHFEPSRRLDRHLKGLELAIVVAGTVGREWEQRCREESDPMMTYVLDTAATAIARTILDQASSCLAGRYPFQGISEALSPGTDGLNFKHQKAIRALLPLERIGMKMDDESFSMEPMASVSGILGVGKSLFKKAPAIDASVPTIKCRRCAMDACSLRIFPFESTKRTHSKFKSA